MKTEVTGIWKQEKRRGQWKPRGPCSRFSYEKCEAHEQRQEVKHGGMKERGYCLASGWVAQSDFQDSWSYYYFLSWTPVKFLNSQSNLICTWTSLNGSLCFMSQKILNSVGGQPEGLPCFFLNSLAFSTPRCRSIVLLLGQNPGKTPWESSASCLDLLLSSHGFKRLFCVLLGGQVTEEHHPLSYQLTGGCLSCDPEVWPYSQSVQPWLYIIFLKWASFVAHSSFAPRAFQAPWSVPFFLMPA